MKLKGLKNIVLASSILCVAPLLGQDEVSAPLVSNVEEARATQADRLGILAHLPKDTEVVMNAYHLSRHLEDFYTSGLGKAYQMVLESEGSSIEELKNSSEYKRFETLVGEEAFLAMGKDSGPFLDALEGYNVASARMMTRMMGTFAFYFSHRDYSALESGVEGMFSQLLTHERLGIDKVCKLSIPAIMAGFKISDTEARVALKRAINASFIEMYDDVVDEDESLASLYDEKHHGERFEGLCFHLGKMFAFVEQKVEEAEARRPMQMIEPAHLGKLAEGFKNKKLYLTVGEFDDYLVVYVGSSMNDLKFIHDLEHSILANDDLAYLKDYRAKDVVFHQYGKRSLWQLSNGYSEVFVEMGKGILDVLKRDHNLFGDLETVETPLDTVEHSHNNLKALRKHTRSALIITRDKGLTLESFGGAVIANTNLNQKNPFAVLNTSASTALSAFWSIDPRVNTEATEMVKNLLSFSHEALQVSQKASAQMQHNEEPQKFFKQVLAYAPEVEDLCSAIADTLINGLGENRALVVDLEGEIPSVPNIPQTIAKNGKLPRVSLLADIRDGDVLKKNWQKAEGAMEKILEKVTKKIGMPIPMQRVDKIESGGIMWYSYNIPGTHQNCKPALGIKDKVWLMTTAPDHAKELLNGKGTSEASNFTLQLNANAVSDYMVEWIALLDEEGDVFPMKGDKHHYKKDVRPILMTLTEALLQIKSIRFETQEKNGEIYHTLKIESQE